MDTYTRGFIKSAGVVSDTLLGGISTLPITALGNSVHPYLGYGVSAIGPFSVVDYDLAKASQQQKQKYIKKLNDSKAKALIPFKGPARLIQRQLIADAAMQPSIRRHIGTLTSLALPVGISALIGSAGGEQGAKTGALVGLGAAGIGGVIGVVSALLSRRRTLKEHRQIQKNNVGKQYLLPGYSIYDYFKALGASQNYAEPEQQKQKQKQKQQA